MNEYEQFGVVAFVSHPAVRGKLTGVQIARALVVGLLLCGSLCAAG